MITILISKIVFLIGLLGLLFIICRKIPAMFRLPEEPVEKKFSIKSVFRLPKKIFHAIFSSYVFQHIFLGNLEKSLRRLKVAALKVDNIIDKFIRKLKKKSGDGMPS